MLPNSVSTFPICFSQKMNLLDLPYGILKKIILLSESVFPNGHPDEDYHWGWIQLLNVNQKLMAMGLELLIRRDDLENLLNSDERFEDENKVDFARIENYIVSHYSNSQQTRSFNAESTKLLSEELNVNKYLLTDISKFPVYPPALVPAQFVNAAKVHCVENWTNSNFTFQFLTESDFSQALYSKSQNSQLTSQKFVLDVAFNCHHYHVVLIEFVRDLSPNHEGTKKDFIPTNDKTGYFRLISETWRLPARCPSLENSTSSSFSKRRIVEKTNLNDYIRKKTKLQIYHPDYPAQDWTQHFGVKLVKSDYSVFILFTCQDSQPGFFKLKGLVYKNLKLKDLTADYFMTPETDSSKLKNLYEYKIVEKLPDKFENLKLAYVVGHSDATPGFLYNPVLKNLAMTESYTNRQQDYYRPLVPNSWVDSEHCLVLSTTTGLFFLQTKVHPSSNKAIVAQLLASDCFNTSRRELETRTHTVVVLI